MADVSVYVDRLMGEVLRLCAMTLAERVLDAEKQDAVPQPPPSLCDDVDRPNKATAVRQHVARFKRTPNPAPV